MFPFDFGSVDRVFVLFDVRKGGDKFFFFFLYQLGR